MSKTIHAKKSPKEYEELVAQYRKNGLLKKYLGIADAHGIESFVSEEEYKAKPFPFQLRADSNRQRHAVTYVVELTTDRVAIIDKLLKENKYEKALTELKKQAVTIGFPQNRLSEYEKSWKLIPNSKLDPYRS